MLSGALVQAAEKPNILFIAIDDMNDWTGFLGGHPQAQTPNMDRLAQKGVNFTNAHCSAPGCSPSRNALLYGVEPFHSGLYAFYDQEGFSRQCAEGHALPFQSFFKANGYNTYGSGKIHHRRSPTPRGVDRIMRRIPSLQKLGLRTTRVTRSGNSHKMSFWPTAQSAGRPSSIIKNASFGVDVLARNTTSRSSWRWASSSRTCRSTPRSGSSISTQRMSNRRASIPTTTMTFPRWAGRSPRSAMTGSSSRTRPGPRFAVPTSPASHGPTTTLAGCSTRWKPVPMPTTPSSCSGRTTATGKAKNGTSASLPCGRKRRGFRSLSGTRGKRSR